MSQNWLFLKHFLRSPIAIGSVMPSSRHLAAAMVRCVEWEKTRVIVELGAGTGVITQEINALRHKDSSFLSFEYENLLRENLTQRYPNINFYKDAFRLKDYVAVQQKGGTRADCIISGLPFANFSQQQRDNLLSDIYDVLNPGGLFVAFQYTRQLQPFLVSSYDKLNCHKVWANLPPAYVYLCRKTSFSKTPDNVHH
ncbi:methyltransferase domain-containing protein [Vreelandella andesensis]|uniref:Methyltransferase domain-containing protein n=1 Tax=Vreelandella andesensis TaxID=447567 RepID=A0A3S0YSW1_9GAMM|nr:methyltransferase domain-containing protein [Halomonas andesensis]RUR28670.1 methyltransferase domain-containing protein [Halomonas andesensis]